MSRLSFSALAALLLAVAPAAAQPADGDAPAPDPDAPIDVEASEEPIDVEASEEPIDVEASEEPIDVSAGEEPLDVEVGGDEEPLDVGGDIQGDPWAEDDDDEPWDVSVFGEKRAVSRIAGSAHAIDEEELERFENDDIQRVITKVPGVYVRGEDGYGLRPNIGMRGANSDRSKKINLLEDGILLGPAPYSAPAAYYFPLTTRMTGIEVFKGPSALRHGPHTIGGTVNLRTRDIPYGHRFGADLALGSERYAKGHAHYGYGSDHWGVLIEGARLRSDGFKQLIGGGRTGFDKMELMGKARVNTDPVGDVYNEATVKLGYSREKSFETYLGLADADFANNGLRRYRASRNDLMEWDRFQVEISHGLVVRDLITLRTTAYRHDFARSWNKVNRFGAGDIRPALLDPFNPATGPEDDPDTEALEGPSNAELYGLLTGARSSTNADELLFIGPNKRSYVSQGIQSAAAITVPDLGPFEQSVKVGLRVHYDQVKRRHSEDGHALVGGAPVLVPGTGVLTADNTASALAVAGYLVDDISVWRLRLSPGVRVEVIQTEFEERRLDLLARGKPELIEGEQLAVLPGVGAYFYITEELGVLGGVHQGFSPVSPGQADGVEPELAINYEAGARYVVDKLGQIEAIGFFSDYTRLLSDISNSGGGAIATGGDGTQIATQNQLGGAQIFGLEASAKADIPTPIDLTIPLSITYTFTQAEFTENFVTTDPIYGDTGRRAQLVDPLDPTAEPTEVALVLAGDEMPYVPQHQLSGVLGMESEAWGGIALAATWIDRMRETPGQGPPPPELQTDSVVTFDVSAHAQVLPELQVYGKMINLLDNRYIVSRRPFGARPGRPRFGFIGVKVLID